MDETEVIRALFAAFSTRDVDAALDLVSEDIEYWPQIVMTLSGREEPYRGPAGIRQYFEDLEPLFERVEVEVQSVRAVAGGAAVFATSRGNPVGGGSFELPVTVMVRLRDNRVVYARSVSADELELVDR